MTFDDTGQYLSHFPRITPERCRPRVAPPKPHRLDRKSRALPIWAGIAFVCWLPVLARMFGG